MTEDRKSDEKFCFSCGKVLHDTADACPHCGANLKTEIHYTFNVQTSDMLTWDESGKLLN